MEEAVVLNELVLDELVLDKLEDDESVGKRSLDEETPKQKAQKKVRQSPLHQQYVVPFSFLVDAVNSRNSFNITSTGKPFGNNLEAYVRPCYESILQIILRTRKVCREKRYKNGLRPRSNVFIIRGSSGVGKSTFLVILWVVLARVDAFLISLYSMLPRPPSRTRAIQSYPKHSAMLW